MSGLEVVWKCRAISLVESELVSISTVPFRPSWTVIFDAPFTTSYPYTSETENAVDAWLDANTDTRSIVFPSGEVICEDETTATLLFMRFR